MKKYKVLSLFSGALGLDLGLAATGRFDLVACVEKDSSACATIKANMAVGNLPEDLILLEGSISDLDPEEVMAKMGIARGEIDVIVGGPPCQAFSSAGNRNSVSDPRGTMLWEFLRFVDALRPKAFLMENVRGLTSASLRPKTPTTRKDDENTSKGSVLRRLVRDFKVIGEGAYTLRGFEVNSVHYGAPQIRERLLLIGNRAGALAQMPEFSHSRDGVGTPRWNTLGHALQGLNDPDPQILDFSPRKKGFLNLVPEGGNWRSLTPEMQEASMGRAFHAKGGRSGWWRRLSMDLPCPTLVTMPNHASTSLCHPAETRALSVREYAAIQGFPVDWLFKGKTADLYRQIGNAVPVALGRAAGEALVTILDGVAPESQEPDEFELVYLDSHVRTRRWFKDGQGVARTAVR